MRLIPRMLSLGLVLGGCGPANPGVPGSSEVVEDIPITGTVFTIVFENHSAESVLNPSNPYLHELANRYAVGDAYLANAHPSLSNYIIMTSGDTQGIGDDGPPSAHAIDGEENLGAQLDAAHVRWRAYMEGMGEPCAMDSAGTYAVKHNPFAYYTSLTNDTERCRDRIVDFDQHFPADLAANTYQFMWITPDLCNDMHDCPTTTSDEWLARVIPMIMESPGYREGGAIFLMWDEGSEDLSYVASYLFHVPQNIPFVLISENLVAPGFRSNTTYGHDSYLATMQDLFGMPRLPTTIDSTPMVDFFFGAQQAADPAPPPDGG